MTVSSIDRSLDRINIAAKTLNRPSTTGVSNEALDAWALDQLESETANLLAAWLGPAKLHELANRGRRQPRPIIHQSPRQRTTPEVTLVSSPLVSTTDSAGGSFWVEAVPPYNVVQMAALQAVTHVCAQAGIAARPRIVWVSPQTDFDRRFPGVSWQNPRETRGFFSSKMPYNIFLDRRLTPELALHVAGHECGHFAEYARFGSASEERAETWAYQACSLWRNNCLPCGIGNPDKAFFAERGYLFRRDHS